MKTRAFQAASCAAIILAMMIGAVGVVLKGPDGKPPGGTAIWVAPILLLGAFAALMWSVALAIYSFACDRQVRLAPWSTGRRMARWIRAWRYGLLAWRIPGIILGLFIAGVALWHGVRAIREWLR